MSARGCTRVAMGMAREERGFERWEDMCRRGQRCVREYLWVGEEVVEERLHLIEGVGPPQIEQQHAYSLFASAFSH